MSGQNFKAQMYLDPSCVSSLGGRPATKTWRHQTHHFEDSESRYGPRERAGQEEEMDASGTTGASCSLRPQGLVSPTGQCRQTVSPQPPQGGSLEKAKTSVPQKSISPRSVHCLIWGATPVFRRMSVLCCELCVC